jgi:Domain of unknown function (DUF4396)
MAPAWLTVVAWLYLAACFSCAGIIVYDIAVNRRRQPMGVMNVVFPVTALYFGPLALAFYWRWGRAAAATSMPATPASLRTMSRAPASADSSMAMPQHAHYDMTGPAGSGGADQPPRKETRPWWVTIGTEVSHCGAGCTLGDVTSEFVIFALGLTIAGVTLGAEYVGDYVLALALGIVFQYFAIAPMRGLGLRDGLIAAAKADFISLTAFEVGLFSWMAVMTFVLFPAPHHLTQGSAAYWLLMQAGMIIGYFTSWPANVWLIKRGIKVPM